MEGMLWRWSIGNGALGGIGVGNVLMDVEAIEMIESGCGSGGW